jgi:type I restriction enzyme S subunit
MFDGVPKEWRTVTLKSAAGELFTDGDWVESKDQDPNGEVRLIQLADIGDGEFLNKSARFLTTEKARALRCTILQAGDLLIARMADPIARCCLFAGLDQPAATVVDVSIVRPSPDVDRAYLSYAVSSESFRTEAIGAASGTTRSRVSRSNLGGIELPLPPLDEQRRVAEVLRSVDEAISANNSAREQAQRVLNAARAEVGGTASATRRLGDVCDVVGGYAFKSGAFTDAGIKVLRISNITKSGVYFGERCAHVSPDEVVGLDRFRLKEGDALIALSGATTGKMCVFAEREPVYVNQRVGYVRARDGEETVQSYVNHAISIFADHIRQSAYGGAQPNISTKEIAEIAIPIPSVSEQRAFASALDSAVAALASAEALSNALHEMRALISTDLFSGRVRVPA